MCPVKVLIVDDHPVLREGISALLRQNGPGTIVFEASDAEEALGLIATHDDLDIVVLDLVLPGMGGLPSIAEFGRVRPDLPVIVLSSSESPEDARNALAQGALGYVPKSASSRTLLSAIQMVLSGDLYVPPLILASGEIPRQATMRHGAGVNAPMLTDRQIEVLQRLGTGQSNKVIAFDLGLAEKTVKAHITAIFKTLNVVSRTQAAMVARDFGLI